MKKILTPGIHWLYAFIPVAILLEMNHAAAPLVFFSAGLAIIPVSNLIGKSTENIARYTGDTVGGLLNATFGNAPELIIFLVALKAGLYDIVLASITGAILVNLLLSMGLSFLVGGLKFHDQRYNVSSIRVYSSMMMIAVTSLMIPSAFHTFSVTTEWITNESKLNISISVVLLICYALYLFFMLFTHPDFFKSEGDGSEHEEERTSLPVSITSLVGASVLAAFMSEILVGAAQQTGTALHMSDAFIGVVFLAFTGGIAGSIPPISMARKNKMDLSIGIALGASIQIALFVAPVLVLASLFMGPHQLNLAFPKGLMITLFLSVLMGTLIAGDGRSNWYKGVQLIMVYFLIAMMIYFIPA